MKNPKCDYGCGQPGIRKLKNGKWLCGENVPACPAVRKKRLRTMAENRRKRADLLAHEIRDRSRASIVCPYCAERVTITLT
jgi:hypothetical protein